MSTQPANALLGTHYEELKTGVQTKTCTQTFTAALFPRAKRQEKSNVHQLMNRQTKCGAPGHGVSLSQKANEVVPHDATWTDLENSSGVKEARHRRP